MAPNRILTDCRLMSCLAVDDQRSAGELSMGHKLASPDEYTKAAILLGVRGGTMNRADVCRRYGLSRGEFSLWELAFDDEGIAGLRDRRLSAYRRAAQSTNAPPPARTRVA